MLKGNFKMTSPRKSSKVVFTFDITMLNNFIGFIFCPKQQVNKKSLNSMKRLFDICDNTIYDGNEKMESRIYFITRALKAKLDEGMENDNVILNYCRKDVHNKEVEEIISNLDLYKRLNYDEIRYINKAIQERLNYYFIQYYADDIVDCKERMDAGMYQSYKDISEEMLSLLRDVLRDSKKNTISDDVDTFDISDPNFDLTLEDIASKLKDPARILKTGIKRLNAILASGYLSKRLYMYLGLPAGFKSGILLKTAIDIKKYNQGVPSKRPGKRKTVLIVTMENTVEESVERLFNMTVSSSDIRSFSVKEIVEKIKNEGGMTLEDDNDINIIIKYRANRSINTDDLYDMIEDLEDEGAEVIALILDYIKRILPAAKAKDEKEELKHITNELKTLAIEKDIPVITAHQLNRDAAATVDAAMTSSKEDVARYVGRSNVGTAFEVMENSDWVCVINVEKKRGTEQYYLTFKRVKIRYRDPNPAEMGYFNHPFNIDNRVRLIDDFYMETSISEDSLATDFDGVVDIVAKKGSRKATDREVVDDDSDDLFNFSASVNRSVA